MAYRRYARSARGRSSYGKRRTTSRRRTRRTARRSPSQRIVIQVVGPSGGMVPIGGSASNVGWKGVRPVRRRF